jgi:hypothetical protein
MAAPDSGLGEWLLVAVDRFGREYLSTREDRRKVVETLVNAAAMLLLFLVAAVVLWVL